MLYRQASRCLHISTPLIALTTLCVRPDTRPTQYGNAPMSANARNIGSILGATSVTVLTENPVFSRRRSRSPWFILNHVGIAARSQTSLNASLASLLNADSGV